MRITIPNYRAKSRNKTITSHWRTYQKHRNEISQLIMAYCRDRKPITPARVTITAYYKGKRGVDTSNIDDKLIIDGIMHAGILIDDTAVYNPEVLKRVVLEAGKDELQIDVEKLST